MQTFVLQTAVCACSWVTLDVRLLFSESKTGTADSKLSMHRRTLVHVRLLAIWCLCELIDDPHMYNPLFMQHFMGNVALSH